VLDRLKSLNLAGPIMVAPGTPEKLNKFLELNPTVSRDTLFVDDSENYDAFKGMRFGKLEIGKPPPEGTQLAPAPDLGWDWLSYLGNVMSLSPVREGEDGVPEGVTLLGGTIVLSGIQSGLFVLGYSDDYTPPGPTTTPVPTPAPPPGTQSAQEAAPWGPCGVLGASGAPDVWREG